MQTETDPMESQELQTAPASPSNSGQPWLASRLLQRQVVNASTVEPVGRVTDVVFDPVRCQLTALIVQQTPAAEGGVAVARRAFSWRRGTASIGVDHIIALNGDVVMVDSNPSLTAFSLPKRHMAYLCEVCELTIVTLHGIFLGLLADVLLDNQGSTVVGYVVKPTRQAETLPMFFEELEQSLPEEIEDKASDEDGSPDSEPPTVRLRVIPASPRVRIGDDLILVVDEVEPLRQDPVVITSHPAEPDDHVEQHNGARWRWLWRSDKQP